jgi:hypothetical protein
VNRPFEIVHAVDAHADRRSTRLLRREANLRRVLLVPVHVVAEFAAVVDSGHVIPGAERIEARAIHQRPLRLAAVAVTVQAPAAVDHADLEEQTVLAARLLEMEPALLRFPAVGPEDRFPGERLGAGERMHVHEDRIVDAVEFDRLADRRVHHLRIAQHRRRMTTETIEAIEDPYVLRHGCLSCSVSTD